MARRPRKSKPLVELLHMLWRVPVYALPFAGFFLMTSNNRMDRSAFFGFWLASMVFTAAIQVALLLTHHLIEPVLVRRYRDDPRGSWVISGAYLGASLFGSLAAAVTLNFTLVPGLLGNARGVVTLVVYCLLFGGLFVGVALAMNFYRESLSRAGSDRELQLARRIQRSFLLSAFPRRPRLEVHAINVSSKEVSGDFYDVVATGEDGLLVAIADVSGKGVPAALLSSMLQASLRTQAGGSASPAAMMATINTLACQRDITGQFATFFLMAIDERSMTLRSTNAGHNFPVLMRADGTRVLLEKGGLVVGMMDEARYEEESIALRPGDRLVLYTDGVTEAARGDLEMFGEERLYALLEGLPRTTSAEGIVQAVLEGVRAFLGESEAGDDITVLALRVTPGEPAGERS